MQTLTSMSNLKVFGIVILYQRISVLYTCSVLRDCGGTMSEQISWLLWYVQCSFFFHSNSIFARVVTFTKMETNCSASICNERQTFSKLDSLFRKKQHFSHPNPPPDTLTETREVNLVTIPRRYEILGGIFKFVLYPSSLRSFMATEITISKMRLLKYLVSFS